MYDLSKVELSNDIKAKFKEAEEYLLAEFGVEIKDTELILIDNYLGSISFLTVYFL